MKKQIKSVTNFFNKVSTNDGVRSMNDPGMQQESSQWTTRTFSDLKKATQMKSNLKTTMIIVFVMFVNCAPGIYSPGGTLNQHFNQPYVFARSSLLRRFLLSIMKKNLKGKCFEDVKAVKTACREQWTISNLKNSRVNSNRGKKT